MITFGSFDLLHVGHIHLFEQARSLGSKLLVGVSSDALNWEKKRAVSIIPEDQRLKMVESIKWVSSVFLETSLDLKPTYIRQHAADILVMGSDWRGHYDHLSELCRVVYIDRVEGVSTTAIKTRAANVRDRD